MNDILSIWSVSHVKSLFVWVIIAMVILYLARKQAHQVLYGAGRALYRSLRLSSYAISRLESGVLRKNEQFASSHSGSSSGLIQLLVSGFVVTVVSLAALISYQMLSSQMVSTDTSILLASSSSINLAAMALVGLELSAGLVLMESLGQTRLLSQVSTMSKISRRISTIISILVLLLVMAASIVILPSLELKVLGAVLSLALAFSSIPFAAFIYSIRALAGKALVFSLSFLRVSIRVLASLSSQASSLSRHVYDLLIVVPLGVERMVKSYLDREVEIDVPILTRVEAEALKNKQRKSLGPMSNQDAGYLSGGKATIKSSSIKRDMSPRAGSKKVIEQSSLENIDLSETMMRSSG